MYRNLYTFPPDLYGGLDSTTVTPPPATSSSSASATAAARTYNQPQQPHFTAATAALQSRGDPHLAGNEACLCSSCHIRDSFFPRSHDGRIVLPPPPSMSMHSTRPSAAATPATRRRNRTDSTASNRDLRLSVAKFNEGRRGPGSRTSYVGDKGEGSSTGLSVPYGSGATDEPSLHIPDDTEGRSFSGPSRRTQHDHKPKRINPSSRILESEGSLSQPSHLTSSQRKSRRTRLESSHGTPRNLLHPPLEISPQTTKLETSRSTIHRGTYGDEPRPSPPHPGPFDINMSFYPETPVRREKSQHHFRHQERPEFSSRSEYPQLDNNNPASEESVNSSPTRELSQSQTKFRFQEPVVPESDTTTSSQELSTVQVKWDSERKRRQGYFAQEEGSEKSPFRHYNKADCDFEG